MLTHSLLFILDKSVRVQILYYFGRHISHAAFQVSNEITEGKSGLLHLHITHENMSVLLSL